MRRDQLSVSLETELLPPSLLYLRSKAILTYRRVHLRPGSSESLQPLQPGGIVLPPTGFGDPYDIPELTLATVLDHRDSFARTTSGWLAQLDITLMRDLNGEELSAARALGNFTWYLEVMPRGRVLVLSAGGGATTPWRENHDLPYDGFIALGRTFQLRGYKRDRFRASYAWWASAEYHYPVYDYVKHNFTIASMVFVDVARAGDGVQELFGEAPRWSAGFGLSGATPVLRVLQLQVGFSPEGSEVIFGTGGAI
jgi:outer membrane protein assembly factor BamA